MASRTRIGIIADTHGLLRPAAVERLAGVDHILHAGDIGDPKIIDALREIAPVTAVRGNVDHGAWSRAYPIDAAITIGGRSIYMLHILDEMAIDPAPAFDVVVSGHSHRPSIETIEGVLYINPGSAGPRRFDLPVTLVRLDCTADMLEPHLHEVAS